MNIMKPYEYPAELICIRCDRELDFVDHPIEKDGLYTPYNGTVFTTSGHYGSTLFDNLSSSKQLMFTICDLCLVERQDKVFLKVEQSKKDEDSFPQYDYTVFQDTLSADAESWAKNCSFEIDLSFAFPRRTLSSGEMVQLACVNDDSTAIIFLGGVEITVEVGKTYESDSSIVRISYIRDISELDYEENKRNSNIVSHYSMVSLKHTAKN